SGLDPVHGTKLSAKDHARRALLLLRSLPPARHAALDHLRGLFDEQVCAHLLERETSGGGGGTGSLSRAGGGGGLEEVVQEVHRVLTEFLKANPKAWAPVVSAWSIDLMGQLSSKYAGRRGVPQASSLNELLQLWMSCDATRTLMEIYTQCLSAMIGGCPDACVDALLDTSVQHSPHFDWVVAHIGSSFPNTIINRVLSCGLKDFCAHGDSLFPAAAAAAAAPKMASVVGILGHLASRHSGSIKQELLRMFHESLGPARDQHQKAAVPFLLQLALMSPPLLATVSPELVDSLKPNVLNQLHQNFASLPREELDNVVGVVVHLVCQTSAGAYRILQFLVNTAMPASVITPPGSTLHEGVREACDRIVQLLLLQLQKLVYNRGAPGALGGGNAQLFGAPGGKSGAAAAENGREGKSAAGAVSLLATNRRFTAAVHFAGGVWSVFHAGVIGKGLKAPPGAEGPEAEELERNLHVFLSLLLRCCRGGRFSADPPPSPSLLTVHPEAAKAVAAALVESVCPEAAGNDLVWPPEDQARGTVERDLRICRRFRDHPLLFPLLRLVAAGPPALCYCSVLLRGLLASLMAYWEGCRDAGTTGSPWHLGASCALVACMAEGSLLPPVLGNVQELFPHVAPFEVHLLLLGVWDYLRENAPLPQKFTFQPQKGVFQRDFGRDGEAGKHLAVLHSVLQKNVQR
ncbi:INT5 protein, partial [Glareola pratincola]|nr:INT5 protein [Glareola pratincola]